MIDKSSLLKVFGFLLVILVVIVIFIQLDKNEYFKKEGLKKSSTPSVQPKSSKSDDKDNSDDGWSLSKYIKRINEKQKKNLGS